MRLISSEIELYLTWSRNCLISGISRTPEVAGDNPVEAKLTAFQIDKNNIYVPVITLSLNNKIRVSENTKQSFTRVVSWNKYRLEITKQP